MPKGLAILLLAVLGVLFLAAAGLIFWYAAPTRVISEITAKGRADVTVNERTVDVHISHLRKKLASGDKPGKMIQTVRGVGYVLNSEGS